MTRHDILGIGAVAAAITGKVRKRIRHRATVRYASTGKRVRVLRASHLHGSDVIDRCKKCGGPIFRDSLNVKSLAGRHVDGSPRKRHLKCLKPANLRHGTGSPERLNATPSRVVSEGTLFSDEGTEAGVAAFAGALPLPIGEVAS